MLLRNFLLCVLCFFQSCLSAASDYPPIRIHSENSKIFEFRGKPLVLLCATEHYGAVFNRPFRYELYLADHSEKKQTLTRLFLIYREQQGTLNPYSSCKPESTDQVTPYPRTGPGDAYDRLPKYDLDQWNPEFFERLHGFLSLASQYGIIVEVVLFSDSYNNDIWRLNPLHARNNINGFEEIDWTEYNTRRHPEIFERQAAFTRKIATDLNKYDNIIYEICNEPGGGIPAEEGFPTPREINEWQAALASIIREVEKDLPNRHLIVGQEAYASGGYGQTSDYAFGDYFVEVVNIHPLPEVSYKGRNYDMGGFMSKQLKLAELQRFCLDTYGERKPLNHDEDNVASRFKDVDGWTIHRKRAWTTLLSGAHYDYIDFSILPWLETGTPESNRHIRTWFKHLSEFVHSMDLVHARPMAGWLHQQPPHTVASVFGVEGRDYAIYLADGRELADNDGVGEPIEGVLSFDLPDGKYEVSTFSPAGGLYSAPVEVEGSEGITLEAPQFNHDIVVRIRKME